MDKNFEHYLLTCFNVNRGIDPENKRNSLNYLEPRLSLFESITVPSVKHQSCSNFSWFVFFDIDTPNECKKKIENMAKLANFTPYYISIYQETKKIIKQQLKPTTEYLVTTNLDNDDAISEDFIQTIQKNLKAEKMYFINLLMGYMISEQGLFMREYYSSPFHTLCQKIDQEIVSCLDVPHHFLPQLSKKNISIYNVVSDPLWLQVVHGSNVCNKIEANAVPIFNLECLNKFNINNLPFDSSHFLNNHQNRFFFTLTLLKNKRNKPLSLKLKLALYILFPTLSIIYNRFKINTQVKSKDLSHNYSGTEFQKLIASMHK